VSKKFKHPVTGEPIGLGESLSWKVQNLIRNWTFMFVITGITITWWSFPYLFHDPNRIWWNYLASYMAIFIETVVGIAMFQQTKSDAKVIREALAIIRIVLKMEKDQFSEVKDLMEYIESEMDKHHYEEAKNLKTKLLDNVKSDQGH